MNNTLTGLGAALVLAFVAALVGPWLIDWSAYRGDFAREAGALLGAPVTVSGAVDARLLPTPYVRFHDVAAGKGDARLTVAEVEIELAIGPLLRGDFRADRVTLKKPRLGVVVQPDGAVATPFSGSSRAGGDADRISFDHAEIIDGELATTAPSGTVAIERIDGVAEAGSLKGPYRFEGSAAIAGQIATLRLATGRLDGSGSIHVKLDAAPEGRPELIAIDGALTLGLRPTFDGQAAVARPAPKATDSAAERSDEPWRVAAHLKGDAARLALDAVDIAYGPDESAMRLGGAGALTFGPAPRFELALDARQLDLDRLAGDASLDPASVLARLAPRFAGLIQPPLPGRLTLNVGGVVVARDVVQDVSGALTAKDGAWRIERFGARLPGAALKAAGAVAFGQGGPGFAGRIDFDAFDLSGFRRWLAGSGEAVEPSPVKRVALGGDVTARLGAVTIENATLGVDGANSRGRLAWRDADLRDDRPHVEASLVSDRLDLDALGLGRVARAAISGRAGADVALSLDARTLVLGGVAMTGVAFEGVLDRQAFDLRRFRVADAQGASASGSGRLALGDGAGDGELDLQIATQTATPLLTFARAFGASPGVIDVLDTRLPTLAPLRLDVAVAANPDGVRMTIGGEAAGGALDLAVSSPEPSLEAPAIVEAKLTTTDGRRLATLLGISVSPLANAPGGELRATLNGAPAKGMTGEVHVAALGVETAARGSASVSGDGVAAQGTLSLRTADLTLVGEALGRLTPGVLPPTAAAMTTKATLSPGGVTFDAVSGDVAGRRFTGALAVPFGSGQGFTGSLVTGHLSAAELAGLVFAPDALGRTGDAKSPWPTAAFSPSPARGANGRIAVAVDALDFPAGPSATAARFTLAFRPNAVAIEGLSADLAGGRLTGTASANRLGAGAAVAFDLSLAGAQAATLLGLPPERSPLSGAADLLLQGQGTGQTIAAVVASLNGAGAANLSNGAIARLDPGAISAVEPQIANGLALDAPTIAQAIEADLGRADLSVVHAALPFTVAGGVLRSGGLTSEAAATLGGSLSLDLNTWTLDADLAIAPSDLGAPPVGVSFEGPLEAPRRRLDATSFTNWLSVRAVERETRRIEAMEAEARQRGEDVRRRLDEARAKAEAERKRREAEARALIEAAPPIPAAPKPASRPDALRDPTLRTAPDLSPSPPMSITPPAAR